MVERDIENHELHLKKLTTKADSTGSPEAIKELLDYLILAHASG